MSKSGSHKGLDASYVRSVAAVLERYGFAVEAETPDDEVEFTVEELRRIADRIEQS